MFHTSFFSLIFFISLKYFRCLLNEFDCKCGPDILKWYSELLKDLENTFPLVFDKIASEVLTKENKSAKSIKKLLGVHTSRNDFYQKLVHPNENIRLTAIKEISENYKPKEVIFILYIYI